MRKRLTLVASLLALAAVGTYGAVSWTSPGPAPTDRLPSEAAIQGAEAIVSMAWLAERLDDPDVVVITTGNSQIYGLTHIPGARFIDHMATLGANHQLKESTALAETLARAGARDGARIVLYGPEPMETGWLYMTLASLGHADRVVMLDGNVRSWHAAGYPTTADVPPPASGRLSVRPTADVVVDAAWVRERLESDEIALLDVRTQREWDQGRLPNATLILWQDLYADLDTGRFKSPDQIRAVLASAGVKPGQQVVTYCAIGMRASLMRFAARATGYDARVYVGSWSDWSQRSGYPVVR